MIFNMIKTKCDSYFDALISDTIIDIDLLNSIPNFKLELLTTLVNYDKGYD